jgi:hypothetical protein
LPIVTEIPTEETKALEDSAIIADTVLLSPVKKIADPKAAFLKLIGKKAREMNL